MFLTLLLFGIIAFISQSNSSSFKISNSIQKNKYILSSELFKNIEEPAAINAITNIETVNIIVPEYISSYSIPTTLLKYESNRKTFLWDKRKAPLVLLHGFDSSCLEFRRFAPLLSQNRDVFIPDILGWGFSDVSNVKDFSTDAKLVHLKCFLEQVVKQPCILVGASLGGSLAINLAAEYCPSFVEKLILIDAQVIN